MPATAAIKTRSIQAESLSAATDRLVNTILINEGVVGRSANSFKVAQDTGGNMQVKVGSGSSYDRAVVAGDFAGQGVYVVEHQNASQTLPIAASDPANPRKDIVILRVYDDVFDSSGKSYADLEVIQGTPATSPVEPVLPSTAIKLAVVDVAAGATAIVDANITDSRVEAHPKGGGPVRQVVFLSSGTFVKANYPWLRAVRVRCQGGGGAGGGAVATGSTGASAGSGGGAGCYAEALIAAESLPSSVTVTVGAAGAGASGAAGGAGGTSSFGSLVAASGGAGGGVATSTTGLVAANGGVRTSTGSSTGDILVAGGGGAAAIVNGGSTNPLAASGAGAQSHMGGGGGGIGSGSGDGQSALNFGGGGGGAANLPSQPARTGGGGGIGVVIVELFA